MAEIWIGDDKVGDWTGSSQPAVGDELPIDLDGEEYHAKVLRVFKRHSKNTAPTDVIVIDDPGRCPSSSEAMHVRAQSALT